MKTSTPLTLHGPDDLTLEEFTQVAWEGRRLSLHPEALQRIAVGRAAMLEALADGSPVYGINTGMGYLARVKLSEEEQQRHQANLLLGRAVGSPPYLEHGEARGVLLARLAGFLSGNAGVTVDLCQFLVDRLNDDFVPAIPRTGVGCAGEIIPLAHAFQTFIGIGQVIAGDGSAQDAAAALAARGVKPYRPALKEGIALLAGAPGAVALAAAAWRGVVQLANQFLIAFACAIDAVHAPLGPYDPAVARLARDPLMGQVLERLDSLLSGSHREQSGPQAPVSFRVIPQVLTYLLRTLGRFEEDLRRALPAVTDSPAFVDGNFLSTGGFHAIDLTADMDSLCSALVHTAELAAQHIHRLLDHRFTNLPDQLTPHPGLHSGLVSVHKRVVGTVGELRRLATPAGIGLVDTSLGQEDAMTFAFGAANTLRSVMAGAREVVACELLVARQAWALRPAPVAPGLRDHARELAAALLPVEQDRPLGPDITDLVTLLASGRLQ